MKIRSSLWLTTAALFAGGCASASGSLGPNGYEHNTFHYRVGYQDAQGAQFVGPDWRLDNVRMDRGKWKEKTGHEYVATRELDENGDGTVSGSERKEEPIYDLKFVNEVDNGVIWVKAHPIAVQDAKRDLSVVLDNYADGLAGEGTYAMTNIFSLERVRQRQFTVFPTKRQWTQVSGHDAVSAVVEIAEVERLRTDPNFRSAKVKIVLTKMVHFEPADRMTPLKWPIERCKTGMCYRRVGMVVLGYYNDAAHFDADLAAFERFVTQVSLPVASEVPEARLPFTSDVKTADGAAPAPGAPGPAPAQ